MAALNFNAIKDALEEIIGEIRSPENMRKYGDLAADIIRTRTRLGYGVPAPLAEKEALKPLSEKYIARRKAQREDGKSGGLSALTAPGKSNLTRTGQLLDSIAVAGSAENQVVVAPFGPRKGEKLTNAELAQYVTDAGRPFNTVSKIEQKRLFDAVRLDIQNALNKRLTK